MGEPTLFSLIKKLEKEKQLKRVKVEVDPILEISEITQRVFEKNGPALLFENVKGSCFPVLTNLFGTWKRVEILFGKSVRELEGFIKELVSTEFPTTLKGSLSLLPKLKNFKAMIPKKVSSPSCQEVVNQTPDLGNLPILKTWPGDAGRFITLPQVITKDPETGMRNVGMYRLQLYDGKTTGMHWHPHKGGAQHFRQYQKIGKKMPALLGKITERLFFPIIQKLLPEIVDMDLPIHGCFHNFVLVSIDKQYPGHARKIINAFWGLGQMMFSKFIIVFDGDVNVHDYGEALWRVGTHVDPKRDIFTTEGPTDLLDHTSPLSCIGGKMGIDATRKWPEEGFQRPWPEEARMSSEVVKQVTQRWKDYGLDN